MSIEPLLWKVELVRVELRMKLTAQFGAHREKEHAHVEGDASRLVNVTEAVKSGTDAEHEQSQSIWKSPRCVRDVPTHLIRQGGKFYTSSLVVADDLGLLEKGDELVQRVLERLPLLPKRERMRHSPTNRLRYLLRLVKISGADVFAASPCHLAYLSEDNQTPFGAQDGKVLDAYKRLHDLETKMFTPRGLLAHFITPYVGANATTSGRAA